VREDGEEKEEYRIEDSVPQLRGRIRIAGREQRLHRMERESEGEAVNRAIKKFTLKKVGVDVQAHGSSSQSAKRKFKR
jgi:TPP-dependent indolepyruvate ferredoxin oxidoreductase alpha subunit